ncbi:GMC family oxidoreductase N-terminal domain-containing protein, partial [Leucobacter soli]
TVRFDGRRAVGVQARTRGVLRDYRAAREVIICAGGIETPQLLERSGIGAGEVLARIGVAPIVENPHVGEHLIEQRHIVYQAHIDRRLGVNHRLSSRFRQLLAGAGYLLTRRGVIAGGVYDIGGFARLGPGYLGPSRLDPAGLDPASTDPASTDPDTFVMMNPLSMDLASPTPAVSKRPGFRLGAFLLSPETEGSLHSGGAQPDAAPVIEPRYLEAEWERETTRRMIEAARDIASRHPLAELFVEEDAPGADVVTTEQAVAHAWANRALSHAV